MLTYWNRHTTDYSLARWPRERQIGDENLGALIARSNDLTSGDFEPTHDAQLHTTSAPRNVIFYTSKNLGAIH